MSRHALPIASLTVTSDLRQIDVSCVRLFPSKGTIPVDFDV
jgi:hypothetical protein